MCFSQSNFPTFLQCFDQIVQFDPAEFLLVVLVTDFPHVHLQLTHFRVYQSMGVRFYFVLDYVPMDFSVRYRFVSILVSQYFGYFCHLDRIKGLNFVFILELFINRLKRGLNFRYVGNPSLFLVLRNKMLHDKLAYILYIVVNESKDSCKYLFLSFVFQVRLCIAFGYFGLKNFSYDLFVF